MKFSSLHHVINSTAKTVLRFPFETISSIVATICGCLLVDNNSWDNTLLSKTVMCCSLGLVVFLSSSLFFDTSKRWSSKRFIIQPVLLALLVGYYFTFSQRPKEIELLHFFVLNVSFHLLVSFAAFLRNGLSVQSFWEFNKRLFIRIITGGIYSGVLFAGLALAILATDKLFNFDIDEKTYAYLFITIGGVFNTVFFLAGVPKLNQTDLDIDYPKGLKSFTQFVLIPLVSIYLVILLAYETKILVSLSLPYGWVSNLILVYAIFGILSFLLVYPVADLTGNLWMKTFNKWFYYFLVPLLGLLYWAILYRINTYGFTHERYYVLVLALWLTFIVLYFLITRTQNIMLIPLSLCVTGLLTIYGPQSAQSVSKASQLRRFTNYMHQNETKKLSEDDQREMSRVVDYILDYQDVELLVENAEHKLDTITLNGNAYHYKVMNALGLEYYSRYRYNSNKNHFNISAASTNFQQVTGYDFIFEVSLYQNFKCDSCFTLNGKNYAISSSKEKGLLILKINREKLALDVNGFVKQLKPVSEQSYTQKELTQLTETDKFNIKTIYSNLSGTDENGLYEVESFSCTICIGVKH